MVTNKAVRRGVAIALLIAGGLLMWLAPGTAAGVVLLVLGIVLEAVGIGLEHKSKE